MGIFFSVIALLSWGVGDFLIQRSARKVGGWEALFFITALATVVLLPFVWHELPSLGTFRSTLFLLVLASLVIVFAAYFNFEALREGKISVIEPVFAFEVPLTAILAGIIIHERLNGVQMFLVAMVVIGIFLVSTQSFRSFRSVAWEKGIWFAIIGTLGMGASNFLFGLGARQTSPLMINWFTSASMAVISFIIIVSRSGIAPILDGFRRHRALVLNMGIFDNLAWVAYSYATLFIPIAIATSISESYIALAALFGLSFNKEKLQKHQKAGLVITVIAAVVLAATTKD